MKLFNPILIGAAVLLATGACSSRGRTHTYSGPTVSFSGVAEAPPTSDSSVPRTGSLSGKTFASREAAMQAVADVAGAHDQARLDELFGPGATEILWSGDEVADKAGGLRVKEMILAGTEFEERGTDEVVAAVGKDKWPFPIPLVKVDGGWRFDLEAGKDELLSRRIGRNELATIATMYAYVDAQREYFDTGRDGNSPAYSQKVRSTAGKHDGLYWDTEAGGEASPFGPLVAEAREKGYGPSDGSPEPFQGYYYKILTAQGPKVSGGRRSYLGAKGLMTGGFAAIAWPATYGNSGIMTFVVNQTGIVFEKDLGQGTERIAPAITEYDPDGSWKPAPHRPVEDQ